VSLARSDGRGWLWCLLLAVLVFGALAAAYYRYTIDDAYISLRFARNVAGGRGLTFNLEGQPTEGYTNFLWVISEAALFKVGGPIDIIHEVKLLGILWGVGLVFGVYFLGRRVYGKAAASAAALFVAATGNFAFWAVGGLETTQYICLIIWAVYFSTKVSEGRRAATAAGVFWLLAALSRPEGIILAAVVLLSGVLTAGRAGRSRWLLAAAFALIPYGAYFLWRWHYFGLLLPNTFYARAGVSPRALVGRLRGVAPFLLYIAPLAALAAWRRAAAKGGRGRLVWISFVASFALAFLAKREWMPGFRYELPFVAFLAVLAGGAWARVLAGRGRRWPVVGSVLLAAYLFIPGLFLFREVTYTARLERAHIALGRWLAAAAPSGSSLATWDMGAVPYFSGFAAAYDINPEGLLSRETTQRGYRPGYFIGRRPTFFILYSSASGGIRAPAGSWVWQYYNSAAFHKLYDYLFTFTFRDDYHLRVYALATAPLVPGDVAAGARLARESRVAGD